MQPAYFSFSCVGMLDSNRKENVLRKREEERRRTVREEFSHQWKNAVLDGENLLRKREEERRRISREEFSHQWKNSVLNGHPSFCPSRALHHLRMPPNHGGGPRWEVEGRGGA